MKGATNLFKSMRKPTNVGNFRQFSVNQVNSDNKRSEPGKKTHFGFTDVDEAEKEQKG